MTRKRILSLWFPRLGAERVLRREPGLLDRPFALVEERANAQVLVSLSPAASAAGLTRGQPVRDARAACAALITRTRVPHLEAGFLAALHRWAGKFSPWVAEEPPDGLVVDLTGCAHLFGGEAALMETVEADCAALGLSVRMGLADTLGAAWAIARYASDPGTQHRTGDAIDQEARATRSRAGKRRHWERGGAAPASQAGPAPAGRIAPEGGALGALSDLPVAALRLSAEETAQLARLGLRRIGDLAGQPRAALARRFGKGLVMRLDQAMGSAAEPISPAALPTRFATRLSLPDPIGLEADLLAGIDRMLPALADALQRKGMGARTLRLEAYRSDGTMQWSHVSLARPSADPDHLRPLLAMKAAEIDAGFGIDMLRLEAVRFEPVHARHVTGHLEAGARAKDRLQAASGLDDLVARIGARIGLDALTRRHPGGSHLPEKGAQTLAAAWSDPAPDWPKRTAPRPLLMWRPEPVTVAEDGPALPLRFRWRSRHFHVRQVHGPERIAPEWWLDDPEWRSGQRDYWRVATEEGERLWLFYAHGGALSAGWFCHGLFA